MPFNSNNTEKPTYTSLAEIRMAKEQKLEEIRKDEETMRELWNDLFHKPESRLPSTPAQRIASLVSSGAGVLDGLILGWKLYRKFKGSHLFSGRSRR